MLMDFRFDAVVLIRIIDLIFARVVAFPCIMCSCRNLVVSDVYSVFCRDDRRLLASLKFASAYVA